MKDNELIEYYNVYIRRQINDDKIISVSGFKKFLMLEKGVQITTLYNLDSWPGVRGQLNVLYEDYLVERAAEGGRNSQTYTQLLNKFYDKQMKRGGDKPPIKVVIDFKNDGRNEI